MCDSCVEIDKQEVTVVFRIGPDPHRQGPEKHSSQHCWGREQLALRGIAKRILQKNPLHVEFLKLFDKYPLVRIVPSQTIRRQHDHRIKLASLRTIAEPI